MFSICSKFHKATKPSDPNGNQMQRFAELLTRKDVRHINRVLAMSF
jgi:hypothetical protein